MTENNYRDRHARRGNNWDRKMTWGGINVEKKTPLSVAMYVRLRYNLHTMPRHKTTQLGTVPAAAAAESQYSTPYPAFRTVLLSTHMFLASGWVCWQRLHLSLDTETFVPRKGFSVRGTFSVEIKTGWWRRGGWLHFLSPCKGSMCPNVLSWVAVSF